MDIFKKQTKRRDDMTVEKLIEFLKDCRPDAEVWVTYNGENLNKISKLENAGNFVLIYRTI